MFSPRLETEKRDFIRMSVDCDVEYKELSSNTLFPGKGVNLSGKGIQFKATQRHTPGEKLEVNVLSRGSRPTLTARGEVVRCDPVGSDQFVLSMRIKELLN